jgi:hypothetical protein
MSCVQQQCSVVCCIFTLLTKLGRLSVCACRPCCVSLPVCVDAQQAAVSKADGGSICCGGGNLWQHGNHGVSTRLQLVCLLRAIANFSVPCCSNSAQTRITQLLAIGSLIGSKKLLFCSSLVGCVILDVLPSSVSQMYAVVAPRCLMFGSDVSDNITLDMQVSLVYSQMYVLQCATVTQLSDTDLCCCACPPLRHRNAVPAAAILLIGAADLGACQGKSCSCSFVLRCI